MDNPSVDVGGLKRITAESLAELKRLTAEAVERGNQERARLLAEKQKLDERRRLEDRLKAENIVAQIPGRAETEARAGRSHAIVMSVNFGDYDQPASDKKWGFCDPAWLKGVAKVVFAYCQDAKLKPSLEEWNDGVGIDGGFNIVVHW